MCFCGRFRSPMTAVNRSRSSAPMMTLTVCAMPAESHGHPDCESCDYVSALAQCGRVSGAQVNRQRTELTSNAILGWAEERQVEGYYIARGKPVQNAFVESFIGRFRDECADVCVPTTVPLAFIAKTMQKTILVHRQPVARGACPTPDPSCAGARRLSCAVAPLRPSHHRAQGATATRNLESAKEKVDQVSNPGPPDTIRNASTSLSRSMQI